MSFWYVIVGGAIFYLIFRESINRFFLRILKKRIYLIALMFFSILVVGILFIKSLDLSMNTYAEKVYSPDKEHFAQVSETNGGATTSDVSYVMIMNAKPLTNYSRLFSAWSGNSASVFGMKSTYKEINIQWLNERTLEISHPICDDIEPTSRPIPIYRQNKSWKDVQIVYKPYEVWCPAEN